MDGHVGHLHCRYRVIGPPGAALLAGRLDRVVRQDLAHSLAEALDQGLGDDPTVYVLRRVDARLTLLVERGLADDLLARRWGEGLAGAVVRGIARDPGDGANLVRFADQAEYVARFLVDLLRDRAWERWYYGAFRNLRDRGKAGAAADVLLAHREHLPAILARLLQEGMLGALLSLLDPGTLESLWTQGLGGLPGAAPEAARPLFAAALDLAGRLGLWSGAPPSRAAAEALLRDWAAVGARAVDWRDARGLALAVLDAVRFLTRRGLLRQASGIDGPSLRERLAPARAGLSWLDLPWLEEALLERHGDGLPGPTDLPSRPSGAGLTPRQCELLADLEETMAAEDPELDRACPDSPANALRLYARLAAQAPRWRGDPLATGMIQRLLEVWARLERTGLFLETPASLRGGDLLKSLGKSGSRLVLRLLKNAALTPSSASVGTPVPHPPSPLHEDSETWIETACAGLFLLLRAMRDLRLPALLDRTSYPPAGRSFGLAALGLRLAGSAALDGERLDPGLALFAGLDGPLTLSGLRAAWAGAGPEDDERFQAALLRAVEGQRLAVLPDADDHALEAGRLGLPGPDRTLAFTALALLRVWARWLRGFSSSGAPYLLDQWIRRGGRIHAGRDGLRVELDPAPLDLVLDVAGYTRDLETPGERPVRFRRRGAS